MALASSSAAMLVVVLKSWSMKVLRLQLASRASTWRLQQLGPAGHTVNPGSATMVRLLLIIIFLFVSGDYNDGLVGTDVPPVYLICDGHC